MNPEKWHKLMSCLDIGENNEMLSSLKKVYTEKKRYYHTDKHIEACLKHFDKIAEKATHPHEVELVIWFHDAVYDAYGKDNELKSARMLRGFMRKNSCEKASIDRCYNMIMATCHTSPVSTLDESLMVDIDLGILGAPRAVFDQFEKDIRKEYRWIPKFVYRKKRKEVINGFLKRDRIYQNDYFYSALESTAKENLQRAITCL